MPTLSPLVKEMFFETIGGHVSMTQFETWARTSFDLPSSVSTEDLKTILSIDYKSIGAPGQLLPFLNQLVDPGEMETYKMLKLLNEAKRDNDNLPKLLDEFHTLYHLDYDFLEELAVGLRNRKLANPSESLQPELEQVTQRIIDWINTGKIVLTGDYDEYTHGNLYKDLRTNHE